MIEKKLFWIMEKDKQYSSWYDKDGNELHSTEERNARYLEMLEEEIERVIPLIKRNYDKDSNYKYYLTCEEFPNLFAIGFSDLLCSNACYLFNMRPELQRRYNHYIREKKLKRILDNE